MTATSLLAYRTCMRWISMGPLVMVGQCSLHSTLCTVPPYYGREYARAEKVTWASQLPPALFPERP
jgi:hypothetical protein